MRCIDTYYDILNIPFYFIIWKIFSRQTNTSFDKVKIDKSLPIIYKNLYCPMNQMGLSASEAFSSDKYTDSLSISLTWKTTTSVKHSL